MEGLFEFEPLSGFERLLLRSRPPAGRETLLDGRRPDRETLLDGRRPGRALLVFAFEDSVDLLDQAVDFLQKHGRS